MAVKHAHLRRLRLDPVYIFSWVCLGVWMVFAMFPVLWSYLNSFKPPEQIFDLPPKLIFTPTLHNYAVVFGLQVGTEAEGVSQTQEATGAASQLPRYFLNSLIVSIGTTLCSMAIGCLAAYSLARFRFRAKRYMLLGILLVRMVPAVVLVIPIYTLWRAAGLLDTHAGLILAYLSFNLPFVIWMMRGFFVDIPVEIEEAALIDGCSRLQALVKVIVPLAAPGMAATSIFALLLGWNEFLFAVLLTADKAKTLTPAILNYVTDRAILWGNLYAAASIVLLPVLIFSLSVQKHLARGLTGGAVKG
ncbi:MAG: carbohydrate ABC transporter permease [Chloroflexota bacterium]|nr:carbohydrate ABC transporter permease [Chloroflexota bacterium]